MRSDLVGGDCGASALVLRALGLVNRSLGRAFELEYDPAELPVFAHWVNRRAGDYVVGLEPSTNHVEGEAAARQAGTLTWLDHGEKRAYHCSFRFLRV
ncbi:MAG TPA: DUF4432 family protein [Acidimicrobiales bacterium]|nr:DUF4432 family protein [Acidimicrobiales bacterium]